MKTAALTFLASLALAAGFAPSPVGRRATPLFMSDAVTKGTVKWCVCDVYICRCQVQLIERQLSHVYLSVSAFADGIDCNTRPLIYRLAYHHCSD